MNKTNFVNFLQKHNMADTEHVFLQLTKYGKLLSETNKVMNLTAISEEEYLEKHFYDSSLLLNVFAFHHQTLLDVGTGAGFPGIVLAILFPHLQVTLLEPTTKRCNFLALVKKELSLSNVNIVNARAEDYIKEKREAFDVVTARAVANTRVLLELCVPFVRLNGHFLLMKGKTYNEEISEARHALEVLGIVEQTKDISVLESDGSERVNVSFTKLKVTPLNYPRAYGLIKKKPL